MTRALYEHVLILAGRVASSDCLVCIQTLGARGRHTHTGGTQAATEH